jgi:hypothetical protein
MIKTGLLLMKITIIFSLYFITAKIIFGGENWLLNGNRFCCGTVQLIFVATIIFILAFLCFITITWVLWINKKIIGAAGVMIFSVLIYLMFLFFLSFALIVT